MDTFTSVMHPHDPSYQVRRRELIKELTRMEEKDLKQLLKTQADFGTFRDDHGLSARIGSEIIHDPMVPAEVKSGLGVATDGLITKNAGNFLDTGAASPGGFSGANPTTGGYMIRQDLEAPAYALFLKKFPFFDYIPHAQANGLVHTAVQITTPESGYTPGAQPTSLISEVGTVGYVNGTYQRATFPIAVFAQGRGVGLKEIAAVSAGGVNYDPMGLEMANAMVRLAQDVQTVMFQGNASNAAGTAAQEVGFYNQLGFDGLRAQLGNAGSFSANGAVVVDQGGLNVTESLMTTAAKIANNGGSPSVIIMSMNAKQALDIETMGAYRTGQLTAPIGSVAGAVNWAQGSLNVLPVPGFTLGTYNRSSDGAAVEDIYMLDETTVQVRYLYNDGFNVLQIPTGVDGYLSMRYIVFGMFGLEIAAPLFCGKLRRLA